MLRPTCSRRLACLATAVLIPAFAGAELESDHAALVKRGVSSLEVAPALEIYAPGARAARSHPRLKRFFAEQSDRWEVRWDARSDQPHLIQGAGIPLFPEKGDQLALSSPEAASEIRLAQVERQLRRFMADYHELFDIAPAQMRLKHNRTFGSKAGLWLVEFEQIHGGLPVIGARVFMRINHGRIVQFGSHRLARVELELEPNLTVKQAFVRASQAFGQDLEMIASRGLAILPMAAASDEAPGKLYRGAPGQGYQHRLAWRLTAGIGGDAFALAIDAHSGDLLEAKSLTYSLGLVSGEVAPIQRGQPLEEVPFPWGRVWGTSIKYTAADGSYDYQGGLAISKLGGLYVSIDDGCGTIRLDSSDGQLDFGTGGGDCQTPGHGGAGNTLAARTAYYYLSRAQEHAASLLGTAPGSNDGDLIARNNIADGHCGAFYNAAANTVDFQISASGCTNPGELPGIVLHEWGHSAFAAYSESSTDGASAEAAADTFSFLETGDPCIGHGFRPGQPCHNCSQSCTGVRDLAALALGGTAILARPDTLEDEQGLACDPLACSYNTAEQYRGPMGYLAHCESQIASTANWDLAQQLMSTHGPVRGWELMTELWYHSLAAAGSAYRKVPDAAPCQPATSSVDGCQYDNWYTVYLAVDDDDGDLTNGTPNACTIWQAFAAHGIACGAEPPCSCAEYAIANAGPDRAVCAGEPVKIGTPARPGHTYDWSLSGQGSRAPVEGWDQATIMVSPLETTTYEVTTETSCDGDSDQVTVNVHACDVPFDGDFEAAGVGWQTSGMWHLAASSTCASPGYASPVNAMYYGQDSTCDYDTGSGTSGELISPWIDGITDHSYLSFGYMREVENGIFDRDRTEVAIMVADDSGWVPRWARDATDPSPGTWITADSISLAPYAGQPIQVRFRFDSRDDDANAYRGWLVDDVEVVEIDTPPGTGMAPTITILDPAEDSSHEACACVPLSVHADDNEDGDLAAIVRWHSQSDGPLGTGRSLAAPLSVGTHVLTASVTDYAGFTSSTTVGVTVQSAEGCDLSQWPPVERELFCGDDE